MSTSYDDCQDIAKERDREDREYEIRQRALGPIGQRPSEPGHRKPLRQLVRDRVIATVAELRDNAELATGYGTTHYAPGDPVGEDHFVDGPCWVTHVDLMSELDDLLDDMNTIEKEGW